MWTRVRYVLTCRLWLVVAVVLLMETAALSGPNVCLVKQKYNITKRIKYRAPMSVRTYEWCFAMPPRCSRWNTEMRDLTRLETEERIAEVSVCCPGYKMKDVSCIPICPYGKTGPSCKNDCEPNRWGPNCVHECKDCSKHGSCSPVTGECLCQEGWQGERCETMLTTTTTMPTEEPLTTSKATTKTAISSSTVASLTKTYKSTVVESTARKTGTTTTGTKPFIETTAIDYIATKATSDRPMETTPSTIEMTEMGSPRLAIQFKTTPLENQTIFESSSEKTALDLDITYNRTEKPVKTSKSTYSIILTTTPSESKEIIKNTSTRLDLNLSMITKPMITDAPISKIFLTTKQTFFTATPKLETTRKTDTTIKTSPTTLKFKPKEIWIRPAQKGESPFIINEAKTKTNHELSHTKYKNATKIDILTNTTPKTIIVSIIPTSVSYATFKKIALSTASYISQKNNSSLKLNKVTEGFTTSMYAQTTTNVPFTKTINIGTTKSDELYATIAFANISKPTSQTTLATTRRAPTTKSFFVNNTTNSMLRTSIVVTPKLNSSNSLTTKTVSVTNITSNSQRQYSVTEKPMKKSFKSTTLLKKLPATAPTFTIASTNTVEEVSKRNITMTKSDETRKEIVNKNVTNNTKVNITNVTDYNNMVTTNKPVEDEEKFHILTEPEHITAVMNEKETERSSVDLVSVISIAGGIMMAMITVAVVIVMMERCRRPRYDNVRKLNDIRMQVMIDNNDVPPPYVRSIFHAPLPEPPTSEKCHYQPISTLDRNLKQFMRPVVVQTISPIMLENFRGILECHYDHLPRRSHDFATLQTRSTVAPSMNTMEQQLLQRVSLTESAIEALKCEAKLDVIDTTTSEPLYAEIPCWRPPSEHAIEIMNVNGEAVTEL